MTQQELLDSFTQEVASLTAQIDAIASSIAALTTARDHAQFHINNFNRITELAALNGVALDNTKLLQAYDISWTLASIEVANTAQVPSDVVAKYFNALAPLIK